MNDFSVQLDLETLSQRKDAVIVSIGAVKFNDKEILDKFYINIDPKSGKEAGLHIQQETLDWWKQQKPEAFAALKTNRKPLKEALTEFQTWYGPKSVPTWGNSNSFDCVILQNAFESVGLQCSWKYYDERCFRTFKSLFKNTKTKREGVHHNALDDAIYQTQYILDVFHGKNL